MLSKVLKTGINEIASISSDYVTLEHPLADVFDFKEIRAFMEELESQYPQFENLRFEAKSDYKKTEGSRYGVTTEWGDRRSRNDLVGDYKTELLENLE
jgi:hypothetical protein